MLKKVAKRIIKGHQPLEQYRFHIDETSENRVAGWVWKINESDYSAKVDIKNGDTVLWSTLAHNYREDLDNSDIGNGKCGFEVYPRLAGGTEGLKNIDIYVDNIKINPQPLTFVSEENKRSASISPAANDALSEEAAAFSSACSDELQRLHDEVSALSSQNNNENSVSDGLSVALNNIAQLSVRMETIEKVLEKHFSK